LVDREGLNLNPCTDESGFCAIAVVAWTAGWNPFLLSLYDAHFSFDRLTTDRHATAFFFVLADIGSWCGGSKTVNAPLLGDCFVVFLISSTGSLLQLDSCNNPDTAVVSIDFSSLLWVLW
jgi:hypothetical protein